MNFKRMKKMGNCLLLVVCCCFSGIPFISQAEESWPSGSSIHGEAAVVMDANSGTVLYEKNAHGQYYPASTTKILTALLAIENTRMEEQVTFSYNSVHKTEGSGIWRDVGEIMTMEQCMYALMLNSANECAYAIAEHTGGTYENFVKMMNDRAAELGCADTHFCNPHGLTEEEHYTSCYDLALISREALQNELFREIAGTKRYDIPPTNKHPDEITYLTNHQKMLWKGDDHYYEYCIGGKTGYTEAAGHTLVTFAEKDGMTLICVVMKNQNPYHYEDSITLLNYCFENFRTYNIAENLGKDIKTQIPESDFLLGTAFADIDRNAGVILPVNVEFSAAGLEILTDTGETETAGTLQFTYAGRVIGTADVKMTEGVVKDYPFQQQSAGEAGDSEEQDKVVQVDVKKILLTILWVVLGILALAAAGFGVYRIYDNFYLLRYKMYSRKKQNITEAIIRRKRRRRRR